MKMALLTVLLGFCYNWSTWCCSRKQILGLQEFANWGAERSLIKRSANLEFVLLLQLFLLFCLWSFFIF